MEELRQSTAAYLAGETFTLRVLGGVGHPSAGSVLMATTLLVCGDCQPLVNPDHRPQGRRIRSVVASSQFSLIGVSSSDSSITTPPRSGSVPAGDKVTA